MKKYLYILKIFIFILLISGCISDNIANIDKNVGNIIVSGKWTGKMTIDNSKHSAKTIYSDAGSIKIILTNDSAQEITKTVTRTPSSDSFYIIIEDIDIGAWSLTLIIYDYDDDEVGRISETINISSGDNPLDLVVTPNDYYIGPENYASLFLQDSFPRHFSLFSSQYEAISYLKIKEIDLYTTDAYVRAEVYNNHIDYFSKNKIFNWDWPNIVDYEKGREDFTETYISSNTDIAATMKYTYSDDSVAAATYSNDSDYSEDVIIAYNDSGKIDQIEKLTTRGSESSTEKLEYSYDSGELTEIESLEDSAVFTLTYSGNKLTSNTKKDSNENTISKQTYEWNDDKLSSSTDTEYDINDYDSDGNTTESRWERTSEYTYNNSENLETITNQDEILLTGEESSEKEEITYTYDSNNYLTGITVNKYYSEESDSHDYNNNGDKGYYLSNLIQIDFIYDDDDESVVRKVNYTYTTYDYTYNSDSLEYERTDGENLIFYERIYYTSDDGSDVTIGVQ